MRHIVTHSPDETVRLGLSLGREYVKPGVVITVRGELGAGKTHLVKGIAQALGIDKRELTSPTYALVNEYECMVGGKPFTLFHLDCYRFEKPEELIELGIEDYLYPHRAATIIEWPERIEQFIPEGIIDVRISIVSETERAIAIIQL